MGYLEEIIKDSSYKLSVFQQLAIEQLESKIIKKILKNNTSYYINCLIRKKEIKLTPEEVIRQLYLHKLINEHGYPESRIQVEYAVKFGRESKRADIAVMNKRESTAPYIIIEIKKLNEKEGTDQLKSYCHSTGSPIGVWSNGNEENVFYRKNPNFFILIPHLPNENQTLKEVLNEKFKYIDLVEQDALAKEGVDLKSRILSLEDDILANAGVDAFEEVFKLIFIKLFDELNTYRKDKKLIDQYYAIKQYNDKEKLESLYEKMHNLEFRNYEGTGDENFKDRIEKLFTEAKEKWKGIFPSDSNIGLTPSHLEVCVSRLQPCKFFNSNLDIIDDAFEYLINKDSKGEKGQYFTPRYVIDMCVKMLNPKKYETMIDPASGSCGFPIHTCFYVWRQIYKDNNEEESDMLTAEEKIPEAIDYVKNNVFAIDFDKKTVRIARTLNIISGDGHTNVFKLNSLNFPKWNDEKDTDDETKTFNQNFDNLLEKRINPKAKDYKNFDFDIIMANPPFAGNIKEPSILMHYDLTNTINFEKIKDEDINKYKILENPTYDKCLNDPQAIIETKDGYKKIKIKEQPIVTRDILFIERNLSMLKPGGRMAIVLPQGRFNNSSDKYIREFIAHRARILAVVGLHGNVFKPHTGTKTSVMFLQKWGGKDKDGNELCPKVDDYNIFFATMNKPSKNNSGDKIYVKKEYVNIKEIKNGKIISENELDTEEFFTIYSDIKEANFLKYKDEIINKEIYENLDTEEKKQVIRQEAILFDKPLLDKHKHLIVDHDLYNHDGLTQDGIAEAFIDFAKAENLSFWKD